VSAFEKKCLQMPKWKIITKIDATGVKIKIRRELNVFSFTNFDGFGSTYVQ
jgi:hypothetical protein